MTILYIITPVAPESDMKLLQQVIDATGKIANTISLKHFIMLPATAGHISHNDKLNELTLAEHVSVQLTDEPFNASAGRNRLLNTVWANMHEQDIIWFLDADDTPIIENCVKLLQQFIKDDEALMLACGYRLACYDTARRVTDDLTCYNDEKRKQYLMNWVKRMNSLYTDVPSPFKSSNMGNHIATTPSRWLFKRAALTCACGNPIRFDNTIVLGEDVDLFKRAVSFLLAFNKPGTVKAVSTPLVHYMLHNKSVMSGSSRAFQRSQLIDCTAKTFRSLVNMVKCKQHYHGDVSNDIASKTVSIILDEHPQEQQLALDSQIENSKTDNDVMLMHSIETWQQVKQSPLDATSDKLFTAYEFQRYITALTLDLMNKRARSGVQQA